MTETVLTQALLNPQELVERGVVTGTRPECVSGNSVDLCIREVFEITRGIVLHRDGTRQLPEYHRVPLRDLGYLHPDKHVRPYWVFQADRLYQVEFQEQVNLPEDIAGITLMRSSMFKSGASGESGLFDSGYCGSTGMAVSTRFTSYVEEGTAIAQMIFLSSDASKSYNGFYKSSDWMRVVR